MRAYSNIMELLVEERVQQQVSALPQPIVSGVNSKDLVAYALNRLPPLYATSQEGMAYQMKRARVEYATQIDRTVDCAIAAIQQEPQRQRTPLEMPQISTAHQQLLQQLRSLLQHETVTWNTLPGEIQQALSQIGKGIVAPQSKTHPLAQVDIPWPQDKRLRQTIDQLSQLKQKIADWSDQLATVDTCKTLDPVETQKSLAAQAKPAPENQLFSEPDTLLAHLQQGIEHWNLWRAENPDLVPKLDGANLSGIDLSGINFQGIQLNSAHLIETQLVGACLAEANLSLAYFKQANLANADLSGANLETASLSQTNFNQANLQGAILRSAYLKAANLSRANLSGANCRDANLEGANLSYANLSHADLEGADLSAADLSHANLSGANLNGAKLKWSDLSSANLSNVQALSTNFSGARFTNACVENWTIDHATRFNWTVCDYVRLSNFDPARYPREEDFPQGEFSRLFEVRNAAVVG